MPFQSKCRWARLSFASDPNQQERVAPDRSCHIDRMLRSCLLDQSSNIPRTLVPEVVLRTPSRLESLQELEMQTGESLRCQRALAYLVVKQQVIQSTIGSQRNDAFLSRCRGEWVGLIQDDLGRNGELDHNDFVRSGEGLYLTHIYPQSN